MAARKLYAATALAVALTGWTAASAHAMELTSAGIKGTDGDDAITVSVVATTPQVTTLTYAPGAGQTITAPSSFTQCTGGGAPGAALTCQVSGFHQSAPLLFDMGPGDDTVQLGAMVPGLRTLIAGGDGDDELHGGASDDEIDPGIGDDVVSGGGGSDRLAADIPQGASLPYRTTPRTAGVVVDLAAGVMRPLAGGEQDTVSGFEDVRGTVFADLLLGDDGPNVINGYEGFDHVDGRKSADWLTGRDSLTADYSRRGGPLIMDVDRAPGSSGTLITVRSPSGDVDTDRFSRLGRVIATSRDDDIVTTVPASISGGAGDDILDGSDGDDMLSGDEGHDGIYGGAGHDHLFGGTYEISSNPLGAPPAADTGDDFLHAEDGGPDQPSCAGGWDVLIADAPYLDGAGVDCEEIIRPLVEPIVVPTPITRPRPGSGGQPYGGAGVKGAPPRTSAAPPVLRVGRAVIKLRRPGKVTVKGRALNADRTAIVGVRVTLKRGSRVLAATRTGKDGAFRLRARVTRSTKLKVSYADPVTRRRVTVSVTVRVTRR